MNKYLLNYVTTIIQHLLNKFNHFIRLNVISLRINYQYKLNIYLLILLFVSVISSIIMRSNLINEDLLNNIYNNNSLFIIFKLLLFFTILYSLKLIFDIINRCIQSFKIIPEFIKMYNNNVLNIKSIINIYYIQNIFFNLLSGWILYIILSKLRLFINGIDIFVIILGFLITIFIFIIKPIKSFNLKTNNYKDYPIWVYLLLLFLLVFYMFILPLIVIKIIDSDKFIQLKNDYINKCIKSINPSYMDDASNESTVRESNDSSSTIRRNFNTENTNNRITGIITDNVSTDITENHLTRNRDNVIEIVPRNVVVNNTNYHINNLRLSRSSTSSQSLADLSNNIENEITRRGQTIQGSVSTSNLLNSSNSTTTNNINRTGLNKIGLKKIKSLFNLNIDKILAKNSKLTAIDFPFTEINIFKISELNYSEFILSSTSLKDYINKYDILNRLNNDNNLSFYLESIINELSLFKNIQSNIIEIISSNSISENKENIIFCKKLIDNYNLFYLSSKSELYNNEFNTKIFNKFNEIFGLKLFIKEDLNSFNLDKLKEFYVLNDLDYLNYKNSERILDIELFNIINLLRSEMNNIIDIIVKEPGFSYDIEFLYFNKHYRAFLEDYKIFCNNFDKSTIDNLNLKYNKDMKIKNINNLKKTRIINYYYYLFNNYNK